MKPVQYFTNEYLAQCSDATPSQILAFLEQFRLMQAYALNKASTPIPSKLISIKMPEDLLATFRAKCEVGNVKYQTQIKTLMKDWLTNQ